MENLKLHIDIGMPKHDFRHSFAEIIAEHQPENSPYRNPQKILDEYALDIHCMPNQSVVEVELSKTYTMEMKPIPKEQMSQLDELFKGCKPQSIVIEPYVPDDN